VVSYEITLPRVEAYEAALADLVKWATAHPKDAKKFRDKKNRVISLDAAGEQLESVPAVKDILIKHQLTANILGNILVNILGSGLLNWC